jgi:hypothetical protein
VGGGGGGVWGSECGLLRSSSHAGGGGCSGFGWRGRGGGVGALTFGKL